MTTLRDALAEFIADYWYGEVSREIVLKDTDAFLEAMENFPESARLELVVKLNPWRPGPWKAERHSHIPGRYAIRNTSGITIGHTWDADAARLIAAALNCWKR